MNKARHLASVLGALAAVLVAVACQDATPPTEGPSFGVTPPSPHKKEGEGCPMFRLTGGGRTDERGEQGFAKNTPGSHDFATFGFNARPAKDCTGTDGSGQQEWNEHGDDPQNAFGAPFAFHGVVNMFTTADPNLVGQCGRYGGLGRLNFRSGEKVDASFMVEHACDVAEPGKGMDHISISITRLDNNETYERHGLLSGGNIQWHRMTGNQ